mmetsp:Transcript_140344/g.448530  ORF Transcript_140344/g.448530 Transcript_140344/m.448530 type:complete len:491 (+) Transcript_140344:87-1559(+)
MAGLPVRREAWVPRAVSPGRRSPSPMAGRPAATPSPIVVPPFGTNTGPASLFDGGSRWSPGRRRCSSPTSYSSMFSDPSKGGNLTGRAQMAFGRTTHSPRGSSSVAELMTNRSAQVSDSRNGITLTREGWSTKRAERQRNSSPGVSDLFRHEAETARPMAGAPAPLPPRAAADGAMAVDRMRCQAQSSANVQSLFNHYNLAAAESAAALEAPMSAFSDSSGGRCHSPRQRLGDRFQSSENMRVALSSAAAAATPAAVGGASSPREALSARVVAPWDCDNRSSELTAADVRDTIQRLTEVAKSALQVAALRINAEKLYLRDMDMTANCMGSGTGIGRGGAIQRMASGASYNRGHRDSTAGVGINTMDQCRQQVASAVADLVGDAGRTSASLGSARRRTSPAPASAPSSKRVGLATSTAMVACARAEEPNPPPALAFAAAAAPAATVAPPARQTPAAVHRPPPVDTSSRPMHVVTRSKSIPTPTRQLSHGGA